MISRRRRTTKTMMTRRGQGTRRWVWKLKWALQVRLLFF